MKQTNLPVAGETVAIMHTNMGDISIKLFPEQTPKTVENFTTHAKNGYYDGVIFHRVIQDFMIQGGDPNGTGTGGESIWGGTFDDEPHKDLVNIRGSLSMANAGKMPDGSGTNGSQFFIVTTKECPWLDGKHTVFGQVYEGIEIADKISEVKTSFGDKPKDDVVIKSIDIFEFE